MNYYNENDRYAAAWLRELIADGQTPKGEVDERSIADVEPADLIGFTQCHFFAGIGGWSYALRLAGWPDDRPVWTGSCPCQPFSSAGKGRGTADERHLWPAWFRLIRECKPPVVFGEQVEAAVRHGWLDGVFADMEGESYACGAAVLGAHSIGAPHIRQRLWWVADASSRTSQWNPGSIPCAKTEVGSQNGAPHGYCFVRPGDGSTDCRLAHSDQPSDNGRTRSREQSFCDQDDEISGVEQPDSPGSQQGGESAAPNRHRGSPNSTGGDGDGLGDTTPLRRQSVAANRCEHGERDQASELPCFAGDRCVYGGLGLAESEQERIPGFAWRQSEPIPCSDGKSRRVESGTFPLVARLSETVVPSGDPSLSYVQATAEGRAMRLRGYGNAIVPPLAAEFIMAYMETSLKAEGGGG